MPTRFFHCFQCTYVAHNERRRLARHIEKSACQSFHCADCRVSFRSERLLTIHRLANHSSSDDRPFRCNFCDKSFRTNRRLGQHIWTHSGKAMNYGCYECDLFSKRRMMKKGHLVRHLKAVHGEERPLQCDNCCARYKSADEIVIHLKFCRIYSATQSVQYTCFECHREFRSYASIIRHRFVHWKTITRTRSFHCFQCKKFYTDRPNLTNHIRLSHVYVQRDARNFAHFNCERCTASFGRLGYLKTHVQQIHADKDGFLCYTCHSRFMDSRSLYFHNLHRHKQSAMLGKHSPFDRYHCFHCDGSSAFNFKADLQRHLREVHIAKADRRNKVFNFKCNACNIMSKNYKDFETHHQRVHGTGFSCAVCHKIYQIKNSLDAHLRYAHIALKKFACFTCDYSTAIATALKKHQRRHDGPNATFECDLCANNYHHKTALVKHARKIHS